MFLHELGFTKVATTKRALPLRLKPDLVKTRSASRMFKVPTYTKPKTRLTELTAFTQKPIIKQLSSQKVPLYAKRNTSLTLKVPTDTKRGT